MRGKQRIFAYVEEQMDKKDDECDLINDEGTLVCHMGVL